MRSKLLRTPFERSSDHGHAFVSSKCPAPSSSSRALNAKPSNILRFCIAVRGAPPGIENPPIDPGARSGILAGASFIAGVISAVALSDAPYPRPGSDPADVRRYFQGNPGPARISVAGQLISAASLARFTASVARLASRSGRGSAGLRAAAIAGGGLAAASLATSALISAALTGSRGEQEADAAALQRRFAAGGPVHGAAFGLLGGSLGLAGLRTGELPRPLAIAGLASAVTGLLSPLYFVLEPAAWLIPAGRFAGLLTSGISGALLGGRRR